MSVAVLIPSRDRPDLLDRAIQSVLETSKDGHALVYIDSDQKHLYKSLKTDFRVWIHEGPRIGPVAAANQLRKDFPEFDVYGFMPDDAQIVTPDWDKWILESVAKCPNRIAVISPYHNFGNHVDMPFVTREWIIQTGWYACPDFYHWCWPILTGLIGEMSAIVHAPKARFAIEHDDGPIGNAEHRAADAEKFFEYVSLKLPATVEKIRTAMYA